MNKILEKKLNEYREELKELSNDDLLFEYGFSCIEVDRFRQLAKKDTCKKLITLLADIIFNKDETYFNVFTSLRGNNHESNI